MKATARKWYYYTTTLSQKKRKERENGTTLGKKKVGTHSRINMGPMIVIMIIIININ